MTNQRTPNVCVAIVDWPEWHEARERLREELPDDATWQEVEDAEDELRLTLQCNQPAIHYGSHFGWNCPKHAVEIFTWHDAPYGHPKDVITGWLETCFDLEAEAPCCGHHACFPCGPGADRTVEEW